MKELDLTNFDLYRQHILFTPKEGFKINNIKIKMIPATDAKDEVANIETMIVKGIIAAWDKLVEARKQLNDKETDEIKKYFNNIIKDADYLGDILFGSAEGFDLRFFVLDK